MLVVHARSVAQNPCQFWRGARFVSWRNIAITLIVGQPQVQWSMSEIACLQQLTFALQLPCCIIISQDAPSGRPQPYRRRDSAAKPNGIAVGTGILPNPITSGGSERHALLEERSERRRACAPRTGRH